MINIIGHDQCLALRCLDVVADCIAPGFSVDVYLAAFMCKKLGIEISDKVIYNLEYLHKDSPLWNVGYLETLQNNFVIDFSMKNIKYLESIGVSAFYMPFGFSQSMKKISPSDEKDIDVLFIGSMHFERRKKVIGQLGNLCKVHVANGVYGDELDNLISRSRVHLNMHHAEGQPLETVRVNYLLANNCVVVSEKGSDEELNNKYADFVFFADYENLVESCISAIGRSICCDEIMERLYHDSSKANEWARSQLCLQ